DNRVSRTQYQYTVEDANADELRAWAPKLEKELAKQPELEDVATDQGELGLKLSLVIDRDTASRLGLTQQNIDDTLYDAFGQRQTSTIFTQLNLYRVILEVDQDDQQGEEALEHVFVRAVNGDAVPLGAFAHWEQQRAPLAINHQGQFPSVTISFNTA